MVGPLKMVKIGLNRNTLTPCGFCFVEYLEKDDVDLAINTLNGIIIDGNKIRVDKDIGFTPMR